MTSADDLSPDALDEALGGRPFRWYPALLSTQADALAWAREGGPEGAVVVADYQASPRGRAGLEWKVEPGITLGFSLILRPVLPPEREGWLYVVATSALADAIGEEARIEWPDQVHSGHAHGAAVGVDVQLGPESTTWAVVNVIVPHAGGDRARMLARILDAVEHRCRVQTDLLLGDYLPRCDTMGRTVVARLIPLGPGGPQVSGTAVSTLADGALVIETDEGRRIAVRPQILGLLEHAPTTPPGAGDGPAPR